MSLFVIHEQLLFQIYNLDGDITFWNLHLQWRLTSTVITHDTTMIAAGQYTYIHWTLNGGCFFTVPLSLIIFSQNL